MKTSIVLHHSANPSQKPQSDSIIAQHLREPRIRQPGAYHYVLEVLGDIVQLHEEDYIGYHAGNWATNVKSIGICLAGNFVTHQPTEAQLQSLAKLTMDIQARWGIPDSNIYLHREVRLSPTACPGIDLRALYFAKREELLKTRVTRLQRAEKHAKGQRLKRIQSILARLLP